MLHCKGMLKYLALTLIATINLAEFSRSAFLGSSFSDSVADCVSFMHMFDYTFSNSPGGSADRPYGLTSNQDYEMVKCSIPGVCPDDVSRTTCQWKRVLSVVCQTAQTGTGYDIQVLTNSLPNHCYYSQISAPVGSFAQYNTYGIRAHWNLPTRSMEKATGLLRNQAFYNTNLATQTDVNNQLCDGKWAKGAMLDNNIYYREGMDDGTYNTYANNKWTTDWILNTATTPLLRMPDSEAIVGIALNGVFIFAGNQENGLDAFFPRNFQSDKQYELNRIDIDLCLGSFHTFSTYRYHMFSPCIYDIKLRDQVGLCRRNDTCDQNLTSYAVDMVPAVMKTQAPIGIAKDGRVIYGPYKITGDLWQPCEVDICNGVNFGSFYGYVATVFHPYVVGCWGPGNRPSYNAQCSSNPNKCSNAHYLSSMFAVMGGSIMFFLFSIIL